MTSNLSAGITSDVIAAVRNIAPQIVAAREQTERQRQIPSTLADDLAKAGLYQMYLPRSLGGLNYRRYACSRPSRKSRKLTARLAGA